MLWTIPSGYESKPNIISKDLRHELDRTCCFGYHDIYRYSLFTRFDNKLQIADSTFDYVT